MATPRVPARPLPPPASPLAASPAAPSASAPAAKPATLAPAPASDGYEAHTEAAAPMWWAGRPLSEGKNAHKTNTREQFTAALKTDDNWFEGDVRQELNSSGMEMRHDQIQESGDNLTLPEWLKMGIASGRGLKLDVKEPDRMQAVLDDVRASGAPQDRLMFNLSFDGMAAWGAKIRASYPNAILAINPPTTGRVDADAARKMVAQANQFGGQATFVVRNDLLSDEAIQIFKQRGTVSVWGGAPDVPATKADLLRRGVDGMIDVFNEPKPTLGDRVEQGWNWARTAWGKVF